MASKTKRGSDGRLLVSKEKRWEVAERVFAEMACGRSLKEICDTEKWAPDRVTFYRWRKQDADMEAAFWEAMSERAMFFTEAMLDIGEKAMRGELDPQAARLQCDNLKWNGERMNHRLRPHTKQEIEQKTSYVDTLEEVSKRIKGAAEQGKEEAAPVDTSAANVVKGSGSVN